ncbi:Choline transport protein [Colletotrichum sp. SAR11_59]|nr:Choline transport protein [Colletotrichum sp. SAR11_59]
MSEKNSASFVFTEVYNETGWSSDGVAWLVGLISTVYPFLGYDAACHLAEELPDAARNMPLAMIGSIVLNGLMGLACDDDVAAAHWSSRSRLLRCVDINIENIMGVRSR